MLFLVACGGARGDNKIMQPDGNAQITPALTSSLAGAAPSQPDTTTPTAILMPSATPTNPPPTATSSPTPVDLASLDLASLVRSSTGIPATYGLASRIDRPELFKDLHPPINQATFALEREGKGAGFISAAIYSSLRDVNGAFEATTQGFDTSEPSGSYEATQATIGGLGDQAAALIFYTTFGVMDFASIDVVFSRCQAAIAVRFIQPKRSTAYGVQELTPLLQAIAAYLRNLDVSLTPLVCPAGMEGATNEPLILTLAVASPPELTATAKPSTPAPSTPTRSTTPQKTPSPKTGNSLTAPVPFGETARVPRYSGKGVFELAVIDVVRGATAYQMMNEANMFNGRPENDDLEWMLVRMRGRAVTVDSATGMAFGGPTDMRVYANKRIVGQPLGGIPPEPHLEGVYLTGAALDGWISFFVYKNEPHPVLFIEDSILNDKGVYFALSQEASGAPPSGDASAPASPTDSPKSTAVPQQAAGKWIPIADSTADYPSNQAARKWWYLWSDGRFNFNWQEMQEAPQDCAHPPNSFPSFICADRAGTDASADIALQWKAPQGGKYLIEWQANTTKGQGAVYVYKHLQEVYSAGKGPTLANSVTLDNLIDWDQVFIVVRSHGELYETSLHVRVYRWSQ